MVVKCHSEEEARTEFRNAVEDGIAQKVALVEKSRFLYLSALDSLPMGEIPDFKPPSRRWYSVTVGRFPGVYNGPSGLAANVTGVSGAESTKFMTRAAAVEHFVSALESESVIQCIYEIERVPVTHV
ncbi:hypothetical protein HYPSUDRAFT_210045 [Hypholoma sublateritium FD-334 SS-4]|uniref:Ribonuclease H1 N-terminal domain-containing protein n=1 Tax=Hypholoma sublateritium (strain FD-334 SS-4) TaxID=945553 RepID=A0A0D2KEA9_HYPSF|nr:hypothetical protein HYPSUDRAFT_210045 [Hypholoma sublateritium FD-334 SS-4]